MNSVFIRYFLFFLCVNFSCAFSQTNNQFRISGELRGFTASKVYLKYGDGKMIAITDSVDVVNGHYKITGKIPNPQQVLLTTFNMLEPMSAELRQKKVTTDLKFFFLSPGNFKITHTGIFKNAEITGSAAIKDFETISANGQYFSNQRYHIRSSADSASARNDTATFKQLSKVYAQSEITESNIYAEFIKKYPKNPVTFFAMEKIIGMANSLDPKDMKKLFLILPLSERNSTAGRELNASIESKIAFNTKGAIGAEAPDFALRDTSGIVRKLSEFRGKYVLVDFWASWCGPCRADNPHLVKSYQMFHSKGFEILSVSLDVKALSKNWLAAIRKDQIGGWMHVAELKPAPNGGVENTDNPAAKVFGVTAIPQNFLIDPNGKIVGRSLRGGDLEKALAAIFH